MLKFTVDSAACIRCGQCVKDCPSLIIERTGKDVPLIRPENEAGCIQCQHCLAICPKGAISIFGRDPAKSTALTQKSFPPFEQMELFVRGRRSVRRYKDENVDAALLQRILATACNAPSGVNRMAVTFAVIDDREAMQRFRMKVYEGLAQALQARKIPERFEYLHRAVPLWTDKQVDLVFRGAPHLLVASAGEGAVCPQEDVNLSLAYFELLAQSAGVGTVWCGLVKMALEFLPELKKELGIAPKSAYYTMAFGMPAVRYARTVQRDNPARVRRIG
jgi:nitroreductase/NAD-dependent dihydropyrimidine dehydrogenase PreA subunit